MKKLLFGLLFVLFMLTVCSGFSFATYTQTIYTGKDAFVSEGYPDANYGTSVVGYTASDDVQCGCLGIYGNGGDRLLLNFPNVNFSHSFDSAYVNLFAVIGSQICRGSSSYNSQWSVNCYESGSFDELSVTWNLQPSFNPSIVLGYANYDGTLPPAANLSIPINMSKSVYTSGVHDLNVVCRLTNGWAGTCPSPLSALPYVGMWNNSWGMREINNSYYHPYLWMNYSLTTPVVTSPAYLSDVSAETWTPALNEIINISAKVTNNGTEVSTYYFGLSVGKDGIYCNRDCYQDYSEYGDYRNVTLHAGQTVMLTRSFKFRSGWFDVNETYDLNIGIYSEPYQSPSMAIDSVIMSDAFNVTGMGLNLKAEIISFNASVTKVAIDGFATINVLVRNNGTQNYDFYVGLSVGKNDTSVFCNRYCYADCQDTNGTAACDYGRTGTIHAGQTVNVVRKFKFDSAFFDIGLYDLAIGVYTEAYLEPSYATDSRMVIGYFNVTERPPCLIRNLQIFPMTTTIELNQFVRFLYFTSYDCDGRIYWRDPSGVIRTRQTENSYNGTVHEYTLSSADRPSVWTYWAESCAHATAPFMTASCETSGNKTFTVSSEYGALNVVEPLKGAITDTFGIPYSLAAAFLAIIITVVVGAYVGYKTQHGYVSAIVMIALFLMFTMIGWIPIWVLVLFVVLAAAIVAKWGKEIFGG